MLFRPLLIPVLAGLMLQHGPAAPDVPNLLPTAHPAVPASLEEVWLVPPPEARTAKATAAYAPLSQGLARYRRGEFTAALPLFANAGVMASPLGNYARYYVGMTELRMGRTADARRTFESLVQRRPEGYLALAAALGAGEAAEAAKDFDAAVRIYERLAADKATMTDAVLSRLGRAALAAGDRRKAAAAYTRVYYEFPLTAAATAAGAQLTGLAAEATERSVARDLERAQALFNARRYTEARAMYVEARPRVSGAERDLVDLRIARSDFHLRRWTAARARA